MEVIEAMKLADLEVLKTPKTHVWRSKATAGRGKIADFRIEK
jgi:hypothetical protein